MSASQPLPLFHVVGFTGHRQLADPTVIAAAVREALTIPRRREPGLMQEVLDWHTLTSHLESY